MASTRLYLVRHGATELSAEDRFAGATNVELSEAGRQQASRLGARLRNDGITAIYSSPLSRSLETARLVAGDWGPSIQKHDGLSEIHHGRWEGLTHHDVAERYGDEYLAWEKDPFTFAPEGGESGVAVLGRALPAIREIVGRHRGERVLVVSHKATIRLLISSLLGIDPRRYRDRLDLAPACLNVLELDDSMSARLILFNDTSHYVMLAPPAS